jgi:hypothetical protein
MFVVFGLLAHLACASPNATLEVPAPSWGAPSSSSSAARLEGPLASMEGQSSEHGDGRQYEYGRRRRLSGPGLMVGGAVLTGAGAIMIASAPTTSWDRQDTPHQAGSAVGVAFLLSGVVMMACGLVLTLSDP